MIKYSFTIILVLIATASFGKAGWILLKAELAQYLIQSSWEETLTTGTNQKPWRWSDTWPDRQLLALHGSTTGTLCDCVSDPCVLGLGAQGPALCCCTSEACEACAELLHLEVWSHVGHCWRCSLRRLQ